MKEIEERLKQNAILPHGVLLCVLVARKIRILNIIILK
jgi:hypothetical protein